MYKGIQQQSIKNVLFLIIEYEVVTNSLWNNIIY